MSKILFQNTFSRTLDDLVERFRDRKGTVFSAWLFEDAPSRKAAEQRLATHGVTARLHSAYKPLLHYFLEDVARDSLKSAVIRYPVSPHAGANRFLLEAYPLAALLPEVSFSAVPAERADGKLFYHLDLTFTDGHTQSRAVFAPNRLHQDLGGKRHLSPTGWLEVAGGEDTRLDTDYERLFDAAMRLLHAHEFRAREPYFERLVFKVTLPIADRPLPHGEESVSLIEAMHEELYFSGLELLKAKAGRDALDRSFRPGQIVPDVTYAEGKPQLRVEAAPFIHVTVEPCPRQPLATVERPLPMGAVHAEIDAFGGEPFAALSRSGLPVKATHWRGSDRPVLISGGQHANETTGVVGALRAGLHLKERRNAHFVLSPLENPDGYALHQALCADNACHMHHAARFTAFGDDLEFRDGAELHETAIRTEAIARSGALLHLNLHGYPAHEWTRPLSGYVPHGYDLWTLPKGFFLILRHAPGYEAKAKALLAAVTKALSANERLMAFNAAQLRLYDIHSGANDLMLLNGFPVTMKEQADQRVPVTLVTEYPDETIYGEAFIDGHTAQMQTVLAAYAAWQEIG